MATNNWLWTLFITILFVIIAVFSLCCVKFAYNKALRSSHILLSLFCRAENNRKYLKLGLELRPGYLAKWIELQTVESSSKEIV